MESLGMLVQPFFEWLLRSSLQASILIFLILLTQLILRRRLGARWCQALWLLLLLRMVLPWAPQSRISIFSLIQRSLPQRQREYIPEEVHDQNVNDSIATMTEGESKPALTGTTMEKAAEARMTAPQVKKVAEKKSQTSFLKAAEVLPLVWLAGALTLGIYICANNFALLQIIRRERPLTEQKTLDLLEDCKAEMGIRTFLAVVPTDKVKSASLFGFVRPRLLLPKGMLETLGREELRYVFLHELGHLKRHDIYLGWLMSALQVLHWFNPLVWIAFYRMRADRELACDALVLARTQANESKNYGRTVVSLLERFSRPRRLPAMAGILETRTQLRRRITMIAKFKSNSYQWSPLAVILIIILACVSLPDAISIKAAETSTTKAAPAPTLRRIEVRGRGSVHSQPSFNGRYMVDVDRETGNLVVRDLATGKERMLTNNTDPNRFVHGSLISRDSKKVAFYQFNPEKEDFDLRIVGCDGSDLRTLLGAEIAGYFNMDAWSPDGRYIFGKLMKKPVQLVRVSTDDGSIEVIKVFDQGTVSRVDVSPDGRYLAYSHAEQENSKPDIFIFDIERKREQPLVTHPANDKLLGWTPDGQHIFFTSDRNRTWDGWLLRVVDGKTAGLPEMIKAGMGYVSPIAFTENRSFYYSFGHQAWNVYTATLDSNKGEVLSDPNPVRGIGNDGCPDWSPDGRYLAYCSQLNKGKAQIIRIRTLATGQERELKIDLPYFDWLRWCPDSRHILITNFNTQSVVYMIDTQTGEYTSLVKSDRQKIRQAELSTDEKTLVYRIRGRGTENWLIIRDLETGSEKELLRTEGTTVLSPFIRGWALSEDGKHIAFSIRENNPFVLKIMSIADGQARTIIGDGMVTDVAWINDDRDLLFVKNLSQLCRVSVEGGVPQKLWEWKKMIVGPRLHPDGQRLAFHSGGYVSEMWVMENFLPAEK
jgi:beta-lactamase regulating signal transducer with metallopeptidase domain/Tol biopolymer transport system component